MKNNVKSKPKSSKFILVGLFVFLCLACEKKNNEDNVVVLNPSQENGVVLNPQILENLGIDFYTVERRTIAKTEKLLGRFELSPSATVEYAVNLGGELNLAVKDFANVKKGELLFSIKSPDWNNLQRQLGVAFSERYSSEQECDLIKEKIKYLQSRIEKIESLGLKRVDLENELRILESEQKLTVTKNTKADLDLQQLLKLSASYTNFSVEQLLAKKDGNFLWENLENLEVYAKNTGKVIFNNCVNGKFLTIGETVLKVVNELDLQFRAEVLERNFVNLKHGEKVKILPKVLGSGKIEKSINAVLSLGVSIENTARFFPILAQPENVESWAKAGITAFLEVIDAASVKPVLAIPVKSVMQDGLEKVFFRRNPKDKNEVFRVNGDFGVSDGRMIEVRSGLRAGDEVVYNGSYELKLATEGGANRSADKPKGHFHADGIWHEGKH